MPLALCSQLKSWVWLLPDQSPPLPAGFVGVQSSSSSRAFILSSEHCTINECVFHTKNKTKGNVWCWADVCQGAGLGPVDWEAAWFAGTVAMLCSKSVLFLQSDWSELAVEMSSEIMSSMKRPGKESRRNMAESGYNGEKSGMVRMEKFQQNEEKNQILSLLFILLWS